MFRGRGSLLYLSRTRLVATRLRLLGCRSELGVLVPWPSGLAGFNGALASGVMGVRQRRVGIDVLAVPVGWNV